MKNITIILLFVLTFCVNVAQSAIIEKIKIENNNRISKETIITYGDIKLNQDYDSKRVNEIIKNLYETNFFEDLKISIEGNTLIIDVVENKIIQNVIVEGIKSKTMTKQILENIFSKDKAPFLISKVKLDSKKIKTSLDMMGYYFSKVESITKKNPNDTIDLIFNIDLGEKAKISKIEFIGDKKVKSRTLRNIIISEENKFWKFISRNKYLNKSVLETDKRLLKKFYLNKGYYDVKIESSTVDYFDNSTFKLTFKIDAGKKYFINKASLVLPIDYSQDNFANVNKILKKLNNKPYSFNKVSKVVEEIDKVSLSREYDFINAEIIENKVDDNKLNIIFKVKESDKFYIERINIVGNNITQENVIRNSLEVDEGDPFNELLNAKSINNIRSLRIFKTVKSEVIEGSEPNTKIVNIEVEEKPTGEISIGAGVGSEGGTIGFSVSENNFLGKGIQLGSSLRVTDDSIRGAFTVVNPNFNYSNKSLSTTIESTNIDKLTDNGYETSKTGLSFGTGFEQFENTYFRPSISAYIEDLTTNSKASANLKKQSGNYFDTNFNYNIDFDNRNQRFQTSEGNRFVFAQQVPLVSEEYSLRNSIDLTTWKKFNNEIVTSVGFYGSMINSLNDENVRITDRISLPRKRLKGFQYGAIGPVDAGDYVGGNYATVLNFTSTLPMLMPSVETVDFKYFLDVGNLWGVDYSSSIDESNKIRSATGIGVEWFTPIGPMTFSLAQDLSKASTDKTESFQFNLGTTF
jgi:outer membrane protein insertion porin family